MSESSITNRRTVTSPNTHSTTDSIHIASNLQSTYPAHGLQSNRNKAGSTTTLRRVARFHNAKEMTACMYENALARASSTANDRSSGNNANEDVLQVLLSDDDDEMEVCNFDKLVITSNERPVEGVDDADDDEWMRGMTVDVLPLYDSPSPSPSPRKHLAHSPSLTLDLNLDSNSNSNSKAGSDSDAESSEDDGELTPRANTFTPTKRATNLNNFAAPFRCGRRTLERVPKFHNVFEMRARSSTVRGDIFVPVFSGVGDDDSEGAADDDDNDDDEGLFDSGLSLSSWGSEVEMKSDWVCGGNESETDEEFMMAVEPVVVDVLEDDL